MWLGFGWESCAALRFIRFSIGVDRGRRKRQHRFFRAEIKNLNAAAIPNAKLATTRRKLLFFFGSFGRYSNPQYLDGLEYPALPLLSLHFQKRMHLSCCAAELFWNGQSFLTTSVPNGKCLWPRPVRELLIVKRHCLKGPEYGRTWRIENAKYSPLQKEKHLR